jgi:hypothetical protein
MKLNWFGRLAKTSSSQNEQDESTDDGPERLFLHGFGGRCRAAI